MNRSMNKILITGVSGFVGKHMLHFLSDKNVSVLGVDKTDQVSPEHIGNIQDYSHLSFDLLDDKKLLNVVRDYKPDTILHFASLSNVAESWKNPVNVYSNNTTIFLNILESVRILDLDCKILSIGSSEVYGIIDNKDKLPLTEESPLNPISPYGVSRASQEMLSNVYAEGYGLDIFLTRSFNHVGPNQSESFFIPTIASQLSKIKEQGVIRTGDLSVIRDYVDVRDVVRAYWMILKDGQSGTVYNICSGKGRKLQEIVETMIDISGNQIEILTEPSRIRPVDSPIIVGSYKKIYAELGWEPRIDFQTSLEDVIKQ